MKELLIADYDYLKFWSKQCYSAKLISDHSEKLSGKQWQNHCAFKLKNAFKAFKKKRHARIALTTFHLGHIALSAFSIGTFSPVGIAASVAAEALGDITLTVIFEELLQGLIEQGLEKFEITGELLATLTNEFYHNYEIVVKTLDEDEYYSYSDVRDILTYPDRL
ncbi:uncharacterized protein SAPINGB_P005889 [Magnusiomyces paraingens]|uniref:Uncharacterized protein n=1 Tax=Magnusiomyces paraingens TaxID=2606893 RepID=A0A5E8C2B3_9ASCO|nr:uncharacterized protein SAPINGB_P005889 [Saprochaete ingens]VVT57827.1 unnamed protein product [Saprochaete ingens]